MLTRLNFQAPVLTGDWAKDGPVVIRFLTDWKNRLDTKGALTIDEAAITASQGIKFPATAVSSTDANTLDDYEEGTWTPTVDAGSGSFTTVSGSGRYTKIGRLVYFYAHIVITTNGTAASFVRFTLPFTSAQAFVGYGREIVSTGNSLTVTGTASGTTANILKYDNTYPGGSGYALDVQGHYEV